MENPAISLFQNGEMLNLNGSHNNDEEEEDLEEQRRRNEEIQNLLMTKLDEFNYDESTVNSSANISLDDMQKNYRNAVEPNEQLKVLYDVRVRELNSLREQFEQFQTEKAREIDELKNRVFVYEAENNQLKLSLRNAEDLLVEKTSDNNELRNKLSIQEGTIKKYEKMIEEFQLDINTYQSTINELQMKLQSEPFNSGKSKFNSTELQKAHLEQVTKLENLLEQQKKKVDKYEKELTALTEDLRRMSIIQSEDKNAMNILTKNFDSAQKQCHDLIDLVEKLSDENKHLKARLNDVYKEMSINTSQEVEPAQLERLKKALVDKSMEMDALKVKARHFDDNIKELMEYRGLKCDIYKKEFQQCENKDHIRSLLLMQNDIQNYRRIIDDKNQQILTLNSTNKDLLEKMELMLSQTRNDIQNFSSKYNLPQLEKMAEELKKSEEIIKDLEFRLNKSEEKRLSLNQKLQRTSLSPSKDRKELEMKINNLEKEKNNFQNELKRLQKDLEVSQAEIKNLKDYTKELIEENTKLKIRSPEKTSADLEQLKQQLLESIESVHRAENKIQKLEDTVQDLISDKVDLENENDNLQLRLKDMEQAAQEHLKQVEDLQIEIAKLSKALESKDEIIEAMKQSSVQHIQSELAQKEDSLRIAEENRQELLLSLAKTNEELESARAEIVALQDQLKQVKEQNLKILQASIPEEMRNEDIEAAQRLNIELRLREELQADFHQKLQNVEKKYSSSYKSLYKEQSEKLKTQEIEFRSRIALMLKECAQKMKQLEDQNELLVRKLKEQQKEFEGYRNQVAISEEAYRNVISQTQHSTQKIVDEWKRMSKRLLNNTLGIESTRERIVNDMDKCSMEVAAIVKSYNSKLKKAQK